MEQFKTIARPYAEAVFSIALKDQSFTKWQEKLAFFAAVSREPALRQYVSGVLSMEESVSVLTKICGDYADTQGRQLLEVMASNKRLRALPDVELVFSELYSNWLKEMEVDVASAFVLTPEQEQSLKSALQKRFSQNIKLNCHLDKNLIGGLVITAQDEVIDGSVRDKLNRMKTLLQS